MQPYVLLGNSKLRLRRVVEFSNGDDGGIVAGDDDE